jgi:hypothetical protein
MSDIVQRMRDEAGKLLARLNCALHRGRVHCRMTSDPKEFVEKLRDPARIYADAGDKKAAIKVSELLEAAVGGTAPTSTIDVLQATARLLLDKSQINSIK